MKKVNNQNIACRSIFGDESVTFLTVSKKLLDNSHSPSFDWPIENWRQMMSINPGHGDTVRWIEFLGRVYLGSVLSIARQRIWLLGCLEAHVNGNYLSFAANLRSLIESSADSLYSLWQTSSWMAEQFSLLKKTLGDENAVLQPSDPKVQAQVKEIEDRLIHFVHAEKRPKADKVPDSHRSKQAFEYIAEIEKFDERLSQLYTVLCGLVHPSKESLEWLYTVEKDEKNYAWKFTPEYSEQNPGQIDQLVGGKQEVLASLLMAAFNPSLINLKILSLLEVPNLELSFMNEISLNNIGGWVKLEKIISSQTSMVSNSET